MKVPRSVLPLVLLSVFGSGLAHADLFLLLDGNTVEGDIISEDDIQIVIKGRFGKTVLKRSEIREVQKKRSARDGYKERLEEITRNGRTEELSAWISLGNYAKKEGLREEQIEAFGKALKLDKNSVEAHMGLGHVRHLGSWISAEEKRKLDGGLEAPAPAALVPAPAAAPAPANADANPSGVKTGFTGGSVGSSKRVACSACNGTGISVYFECKQCKRSPKPGYVNLGERLEICRSCKGTAKLPGVPCKPCLATGKVDPEHPRTAGGAEIPKGYHVCATCSGIGWDSWIPCKQCLRSPAPGWLDMNGVYLMMCNRCHGEGKLPGTVCKECTGKCILRDK